MLQGACAGRIYYQEFSVLVDREVLISFEPSFTNYTVIVAPVGNLNYTITHSPSELHFIPHDNGSYIIRVTGVDVYNDNLVLVYVINAYGKIVPPPPPSFSFSSEITTVLNKSVVFNYPCKKKSSKKRIESINTNSNITSTTTTSTCKKKSSKKRIERHQH